MSAWNGLKLRDHLLAPSDVGDEELLHNAGVSWGRRSTGSQRRGFAR